MLDENVQNKPIQGGEHKRGGGTTEWKSVKKPNIITRQRTSYLTLENETHGHVEGVRGEDKWLYKTFLIILNIFIVGSI